MADGQGPTNTTKNAGPNEPFGKKSKIVRRNPQMNTPATFAASNDRKTFSDNVRKRLDGMAVDRAMSALQHVKEEPFPEGDEGDEVEEIEEGSGVHMDDRMRKAAARNMAATKKTDAPAKGDAADKAYINRLKKKGTASFISVRKEEVEELEEGSINKNPGNKLKKIAYQQQEKNKPAPSLPSNTKDVKGSYMALRKPYKNRDGEMRQDSPATALKKAKWRSAY